MRDMVDVHHATLERISDSVDLFDVTSPAKPAALLLTGQPTVVDPGGYTIVVGQSSSMLSATGEAARWMADPQWMSDFAAGWVAPLSIGFALMFTDADRANVVGWSFGGSTIGSITRSGHPEVPAHIALIAMTPPSSSIFKSQLALKMLVALHDQDTICEGMW